MSEPAPKTFMGDLADPPVSLLPLVARRHWVSWKWVLKDGRWTKPPFRATIPNNSPNPMILRRGAASPKP